MHRTDAAETDLTIDGNRDANLSAHSQTLTASTPATVNGRYAMSATFYAGSDEAGAVVGTAGADVKLGSDGNLTNPDGSALGTIGFTGTTASAKLVPNQSVRVGGTATLVAEARNSSNGVLAVSPGSFIFTQQSGSGNATVEADGEVVGIQLGTVTASVQIDGVTSPIGSFSVIPAAPSVVSLQLETQDLAYSAATGRVYAAVFSPAAQVVPINPDTAAAETPIPCSNTPLTVTVSTDGNHLYVGESNGKIERFAIPSGTLEGSFTLPAGTLPTQMITLPNVPDSWVVATQAGSGFGVAQQAFVFDGITPRADTSVMGHSIAVNEDGTKLFGSQRFFGPRFYTATIAPTGLTNVTSAVTDVSDRIRYAAGKIVCDGGAICDPVTGAATGQFTFTTVDHVLGVEPGSNRVYYAAWDPKQVQAYDIGTSTAVSSFSLGSVSGGMETATWCGPKRFAIRSFSGSPNVVLIVSGLP